MEDCDGCTEAQDEQDVEVFLQLVALVRSFGCVRREGSCACSSVQLNGILELMHTPSVCEVEWLSTPESEVHWLVAKLRVVTVRFAWVRRCFQQCSVFQSSDVGAGGGYVRTVFVPLELLL